MPTIARFSSTTINMYFDDHNPPHFHVRGVEGQAQVRIDTLEILKASGRLDLSEALAWAEDNRALLWATWREFSGDAQ